MSSDHCTRYRVLTRYCGEPRWLIAATLRRVSVLGVDAAGKVWVGVELADGRFARALTFKRLRDVALAAYEAVAIDIPLGLLDSGVREADELCRKRVGIRRGSVFMTLPRRVLMEDSHEAATALHKHLTGKGCSRQSYGLRTRIFEADELNDGSLPLFEVHPELSFTMMAGGIPPAFSKNSWHGQHERIRRLESVGIVVPSDAGAAGVVEADDILDAAAAAWSAQRIAAGVGRSLPDPPQPNDHGQRMAIWF